MTETTAPPTTGPLMASRQRKRSSLNAAVADRAGFLQRQSLADRPSAVRTLAVLRRAVGTSPGSAPEVWEDTIGRLPEDLLGRGDDPSPSELAVHHAMTLFALHRQGRCERAHVEGAAPGNAFARVSQLRGAGDESEGVRRRFDALVTASTADEAAHHLRGLILLARAEDVGLDYGYLAADLADLWTPGRRDRVRLRWARQYRAKRTPAEASGTDSASESATDTTSEE